MWHSFWNRYFMKNIFIFQGGAVMKEKSIFDNIVYKIIVVMLLFNFLVMCFKLNNLDSDHNMAWSLALKYFWLTEVFILKVLLTLCAGYLLFFGLRYLFNIMTYFINTKIDKNEFSEEKLVSRQPILNTTEAQEKILSDFRKECAQHDADVAAGKVKSYEAEFQESVRQIKESNRLVLTSVQPSKPKLKIVKSSMDIRKEALRSLTGGNSNE